MIITNNTYLSIATKVNVDFMWVFTYIFIVVGILYLLITFLTKSNLVRGFKSRKIKKKLLGPIVSEFLFFDEESASIEEKKNYINLKIQIRQLLKNKSDRSVLSKILVELSQDLSGEALHSLFALYKNLGLEKDATLKLDNWKWYTISQGILELTQMQVLGSYAKISKFVNDRRSVISKQAVIAIVSLKSEGINYFLDTTEQKISEWQQLKILEILKNKKTFTPPRFKNWLFSKNTDTVLFALRLIKYYDQNDANNAITQLVRHKNNLIRLEAVKCVGEFNLIEARGVLKDIFWTSTNDCKLLIIEAIELLGFKDDVEFLQLINNSKQEFAIKNKALAAINSLLPNNDLKLSGLEEISTKPLKSIAKNDENEKTKPPSIIVKAETIIETTLPSKIDETQDLIEICNINKIDVMYDIIDVEETIFIDFNINDEIKSVEDSTELLEENIPLNDVKHIEYLQFMNSKNNESNDDEYKSLYLKQDSYSKFNLLEKIEDVGGTYDIPLLDFIIKNETLEELKNKAKQLKNIILSQDIDSSEKEESKVVFLPEQSIFKDLYHSCDTEVKLILLGEIAMLGDEKELQFVIEELNSEEKIIRKKAVKAKLILEKRIEDRPIDISDEINKYLNFEFLCDFNAIKEFKTEPNNSNQRNLIPLEYCFLLEISPQKSVSFFDFNFEISKEYH